MPGEVRARVAWKRVKKEMGMRCSFPRDAERGTVLARPLPSCALVSSSRPQLLERIRGVPDAHEATPDDGHPRWAAR